MIIAILPLEQAAESRKAKLEITQTFRAAILLFIFFVVTFST
jgi:hypothetical protein